MRSFRFRKDHLSAALLLMIGGGVLGLGVTYDVGSLHRMGSGFIPVALGILMILVAIAIGATAAPPSAVPPKRQGAEDDGGPQWRGWLCVIASVATFVVLGNYGGLVPATFVTVFLAATGDRESTWKGSAMLAAAITVFGAAIFHYGLSLQLPLFQWGG